ncbi:MAG: PRC-barrel domain-containing protein [Defluviimonas sp.]|nr:PRC-barrel domain-containing protein [Defluviimonas sp.]
MKKLLASTAIVAMTALPLAAQTTTDTTAPGSMPSTTTDSTAPSATGSAAADSTMGTGDFTYTAMNDEIMASDFIGKPVYVSEGDIPATAVNDADAEWENAGEINDVLMSRDGQAKAILVDVGGFLGIGEKTVAVDMGQLRIIEDGDDAGDYFVAFSASREALENAPEFEMDESDDAAMTDTTATGAATTGMAGTDTSATGATTGMAGTDTAATGMGAGMGSGDTVEGRIDPTTLTAEQLQGAAVYDANDERVGDISELVLAEDGTISKAVVDIGGFLGIGAKPVALNFDQLQITSENEDGSDIRVHLMATEEELEAMPEYED